MLIDHVIDLILTWLMIAAMVVMVADIEDRMRMWLSIVMLVIVGLLVSYLRWGMI